jgi:hypothetical protein
VVKVYTRINDEAFQKIKNSGVNLYSFTQQAIYEKLQRAESKEVTPEQIEKILLTVIKEQLQNINIQKNIFDEMHNMDKKYREDSRGAVLKILSEIENLKKKLGGNYE